MPNSLTTRDLEQTYRKACHQAAARLHDLVASRCKTLPEAVELLGRAEDVLAEFREGRADPTACLLDEMESRLLRGAT